jgi:hypothetical protein
MRLGSEAEIKGQGGSASSVANDRALVVVTQMTHPNGRNGLHAEPLCGKGWSSPTEQAILIPNEAGMQKSVCIYVPCQQRNLLFKAIEPARWVSRRQENSVEGDLLNRLP